MYRSSSGCQDNTSDSVYFMICYIIFFSPGFLSHHRREQKPIINSSKRRGGGREESSQVVFFSLFLFLKICLSHLKGLLVIGDCTAVFFLHIKDEMDLKDSNWSVESIQKQTEIIKK